MHKAATTKRVRKVAPRKTNAQRAKSGCYTCRIRRKKCDEKMQPQTGCCETCVRLNIECLGFGQKRPEWLTASKADNLRLKIKHYLAIQNNKAGQLQHSRCFLRLRDDTGPMSPLMSPDDFQSEMFAQGGLTTLNQGNLANIVPYIPPDGHHISEGSQSATVFNSPQPSHFGAPLSDIGISFGDVPVTTDSSMLFSNIDPKFYLNNANAGVTGYESPMSHQSLAVQSSFSPHYHSQIEGDDLAHTLHTSSYSFGSPAIYWHLDIESLQLPIMISRNDLVFYLDQIVGKQYQLNDPRWLRTVLRDGVQKSQSCQVAAGLLAIQSQRRIGPADFKNTLNFLRLTLIKTGNVTVGDAIASLQSVSAVLFNGGIGFHWRDFLSVARNFTEKSMAASNTTPAEVLMRCSSEERFVIKITLWFDLLASITLQERSQFSYVFQNLYEQAEFPSTPEEYCMLRPMGCENRVAWALCQIIALAKDKAIDQSNGVFSAPRLVEKGNSILRLLEPRRINICDKPEDLRSKPSLETIRLLTSEVFRTTAIVFLHNVLSGDYPNCPEIKAGIQGVLSCLRQVPMSAQREVIRSVVSCICICGCLTDNIEERRYLVGLLQAQYALEAAGNSRQVEIVMNYVWEQRANGNFIEWRKFIQDYDILLV